MSYELVRGMNDVLPGEVGRWRLVEEAIRDVARRYNYREIRFPIVEQTELFTRGIGEATEVVTKQMFTFPDQKGRSLTLRPEGTASAARAYLSHGLQTTAPFQKWFYLGPMFRYEKPQKGRYRQFHQYGIEALGSLDPSLDVEVIAFAWTLMTDLGLGGLSLRLNSIGCAEDREAYQGELRAHFAGSIGSMCADCQRRYEDNPLRILDCKEAGCRPFIETAPGPADHLCEECAAHFAAVRELLDRLELLLLELPRGSRPSDTETRSRPAARAATTAVFHLNSFFAKYIVHLLSTATRDSPSRIATGIRDADQDRATDNPSHRQHRPRSVTPIIPGV